MPFADVDGVRLHYSDTGRRRPAGDEAPVPLVLLHAFPLHAGMWADQAEALGSDRRVIAPDLPGFGRSEAPESLFRYTVGGYADLVAGLLDRLGLARVVLGGLSMGGYVTFAFLRHHAERVAGVVLADTKAAADTDAAVERRTEQQDQVARIGTTALIETLLTGLLSDQTFATRSVLVDRVRRLMDNPAAGFIGALEAMKRRPDATAELPGISVPTLVVVGEADAATPPDVATAMHEAIPGSELAVLAGAAHLSNLEATDGFNAAVGDFLSRV